MNGNQNNADVKLRRVLSLSDLVIYGIILIQPVAVLPLFGHANNLSKGHAVTEIFAHITKIANQWRSQTYITTVKDGGFLS